VAVAASILTAIYFVLREKIPYRDLGTSHFDTIAPAKAIERLVSRLQNLGYDVELKLRDAA
jgi:transposase